MKLSAMVVAATMLTATAVSTTAKADHYGGPIRNGNQCWTYSVASLHHEFGYWSPCPAPVAATHRVQPHSKKS